MTMRLSSEMMEIENDEKKQFLNKLHHFYGTDIAILDDLNPSTQKYFEELRHLLNSFFELKINKPDVYPKRILLSATQKCTYKCPHCWIFSYPATNCSLSMNHLNSIHKHITKSESSIPTWTLTGGELFILPYFDSIIERYPVQCVYTNAFWGHPLEKCHAYIDRLKKALFQNPLIDLEKFTIIISFDQYHREGCNRNFPLATSVATIIHFLYENLPGISVRISHTSNENDKLGYIPVIKELEGLGYCLNPTERNTLNTNIHTKSYIYSKGDSIKKELSIDTFPPTPICRGLINYEPEQKRKKTPRFQFDQYSSSRSFHQYTVGSDGCLGLYEILHAPPVPFTLGDLTKQPWANIEQNILNDPIAISLKFFGIDPIVSCMKKYYPELFHAIHKDIQTVQQFLYLVLLNPFRRLFINLFLYSYLKNRNVFYSVNNSIDKQIDSIYRENMHLSREKILNLYKLLL